MKNRGSVLLVALIASVVLTSLAVSLAIRIRAHAAELGEFSRAQNARAAAWNQAMTMVVGFLATNNTANLTNEADKISLNSASEEMLCEFFPRQTAHAIAARRELLPFVAVEELRELPEISAANYEKAAPFVTAWPCTASTNSAVEWLRGNVASNAVFLFHIPSMRMVEWRCD